MTCPDNRREWQYVDAMAAVTVFVDDAVLGRLPYLCAKTGAPGEGLLTIHHPVGGQTRLGIWWLLLLAGPLGWLALMFLMWTTADNGETLTIQVPWTETAQHDHDQARERRRNRWLVSLGLVLAAGVASGIGSEVELAGEMTAVLLIVAAVFGVAAVVGSLAVDRTAIGVQLDASRRWVTLRGVHPDFAHAVELSRSGRHPTAP